MAKYLDLGGLSTLWTKIKAALAKKQDAITAGRRISVSSGGTVSVPVHDLTATIDTAGQCAELFKFTVPSGSAACVKFRFVGFNGNNKGVQNGEVSLRYYNNGTTCTLYEKSSTFSFAVKADGGHPVLPRRAGGGRQDAEGAIAVEMKSRVDAAFDNREARGFWYTIQGETAPPSFWTGKLPRH